MPQQCPKLKQERATKSLLSHFSKLSRHELKLHIDGGVSIHLPGVVRHRSDNRTRQCDKMGQGNVIEQGTGIQRYCTGHFCSPELTHCNRQRTSKMTGTISPNTVGINAVHHRAHFLVAFGKYRGCCRTKPVATSSIPLN